LNLSAAFNYNKTELTKIKDTPAALLALPQDSSSSINFLGRATAADLTVNLPTNKTILSARWSKGPVRIGTTLTRYGSYKYVSSNNPAQELKFGAKALFDLDLTYSPADSLDLTLGAVNLFSVKPDKVDLAPGLTNTTGAASALNGPSPFAPSGGFYYGKIVYRL